MEVAATLKPIHVLMGQAATIAEKTIKQFV
jgi:hypothetical protein